MSINLQAIKDRDAAWKEYLNIHKAEGDRAEEQRLLGHAQTHPMKDRSDLLSLLESCTVQRDDARKAATNATSQCPGSGRETLWLDGHPGICPEPWCSSRSVKPLMPSHQPETEGGTQ